MDNLEAFAKQLGFKKPGTVKHNKYIIELTDSDEYAKYYTILDHSDLELTDTSSMSSEFANVLVYKNDEYKVTLNANFTDNYYTVVVEEL